MGYRPPEQSLKDPAEKVLSALEELEDACKARFKSGDWTLEHLSQLSNLLVKIAELRGTIAIVVNDTW